MSFCTYIFWNKLWEKKNCVCWGTWKLAGFICVIEHLRCSEICFKKWNLETWSLTSLGPYDKCWWFLQRHTFFSSPFHIYFFENVPEPELWRDPAASAGERELLKGETCGCFHCLARWVQWREWFQDVRFHTWCASLWFWLCLLESIVWCVVSGQLHG